MEKTAYPIHPKFCCDLSLSNKEHAKAKALEEKSRKYHASMFPNAIPVFPVSLSFRRRRFPASQNLLRCNEKRETPFRLVEKNKIKRKAAMPTV
jgi:hypothetical protein